jgi:hypothetical protein
MIEIGGNIRRAIREIISDLDVLSHAYYHRQCSFMVKFETVRAV